MNYWLIKSEPSVYSWDDLVREKQTAWTGIRNYAARLHLNNMRKGDKVFFYHSNEGMKIIGTATVTKEAYPDPTTDDQRWVAVDLKVDKPLAVPVTLDVIKKNSNLKNMALVRISRLSVQPVTDAEWTEIHALSKKY